MVHCLSPCLKIRNHFNVSVLEALIALQCDSGFRVPLDEPTKLALAKYYYKDTQYEAALQMLASIYDTAWHKEGKICPWMPPGELQYCTGLVLRKLQRTAEALKQFEKAEKLRHPNAKCCRCTNVVLTSKHSKAELDEFIAVAESCKYASSSIDCINMASTAYYMRAKAFSVGEARAIDFRTAVDKADTAIQQGSSWVGYYNKACDRSIMAALQIAKSEDIPFSPETSEEYTEEIFLSLENAFAQEPRLILHSKTENDLRWVKETHAERFHCLVGRVYACM